jgi:putative tryptophan/tyrosine transport system substrate-binding protein
MRRRDFITSMGGAAVAWPLAARAQQPGKLPIIGFLGSDQSGWTTWTAAFVKRLQQLGWIEDRTVTIEYRWAQGNPDRAAEVALEFVRMKVDVIVSYGTAIPAIKQATSTIPVVFGTAIDPVGGGLVASLAHPGGNVTGLSTQQTDAAGKRLELLRGVIPRLHRLVVMADVANPQAELEMGQVLTAARSLGLEVVPLEIRQAQDIASGFAALKGPADALYIVQDTLTVANRTQVITFALSARLPAIVSGSDFVKAGALLSFGPNYPSMFQRAAEYVDKILRGTKPGDLPVEQPTKFDLVVNLSTARALGLTIPDTFLSLADELIE